MTRLGLYKERARKYPSSQIQDVVGQLGDRREGDRSPLFADAFMKCECGATMRSELDYVLHTHAARICLFRTDRPASRNPLDSL